MKRAICIGINDYPGTYNDLYGCVNDANDWAAKFSDLEFDVVETLLNKNATRANIISKLKNMIFESQPGDLLVFQYSGHGTNVPDTSDPDEADGYDEALYVYDGEILDDTFRHALINLKDGVLMLFILDSCFSGTMTRGDIRTRGPSHRGRRYMPHTNENFSRRVRSLKRRRKFMVEEDMKELLLSGCSDNEYSYDADINGRYNGAMSYTALAHLDESLSYEEWYTLIRSHLPSNDFPQTPQLEGREENKEQQVFTEPIESSSVSSAFESSSSQSSSSAEEPPVIVVTIEPPSWVGVFLTKFIEWLKNLFGWR